MSMSVRAYPLRAGQAALKSFGATLLSERRKETDDFFKRHGVKHESWHMQRIEGVTWVICCTQLHDRATTEKSYGESKLAFDVWFKDQVMALCGIDPNKTPLGLPSEQIFAWDDLMRPGATAL
jgi:hypothetical protein